MACCDLTAESVLLPAESHSLRHPNPEIRDHRCEPARSRHDLHLPGTRRNRELRVRQQAKPNGVLGLIIRPQEWSKFLHIPLVLFISVTNKSKRSGQKIFNKETINQSLTNRASVKREFIYLGPVLVSLVRMKVVSQ